MKSVFNRRFVLKAVSATLMASPLMAAASEDYPSRPITLVIPFAPGGGTDSIGRELAKFMSDKLGQSVVVENRGGGGGSIASRYVAKAKPDGYTIMLATSTFVTHASTEAKPSYDVVKDYAQVALLGRGPLMIVSYKGLGLKTVKDLVEASHKDPNGLHYCSSGLGGITHLAGELFRQKTGANLTHIPYKGSGPATVDLLAGRTQVFFTTIPTMLGHVKTGSVDVLATTGPKRLDILPHIPTAAEAGISDYSLYTWWGIVAPAGTPDAIVQKLNKVVNEATSKDPLKGRLVNEGAESFSGTPADFRKMLGEEMTMWKNVVKKGNIQIH
jgi:tripartite-type tricarboxylate transporter receptor subunit TctC